MRIRHIIFSVVLLSFATVCTAQEKKPNLWQRVTKSKFVTKVDSILDSRYHNTSKIDTNYVTRPQKKFSISARFNMTGAKIKTEGHYSGHHFKSEMKAEYKSTVSLGISYLGLSLSASLNPAKMMGKYHDYELNFKYYGKRFGFDLSYQESKNFTGWNELDDEGRVDLPADMLSVKMLNINAYYCFNSRKFSYPSAFSPNYIQRRSAGSFLLSLSGQGQRGTVNDEVPMKFKMTNIGVGGGYGYNYVPRKGWLFHISALPTLIVFSKTSLTISETEVPLHYYFPEVIITGRGAIVKQAGRMFFGISGVYNFCNIGNKERLAVDNIKWNARAYVGIRL